MIQLCNIYFSVAHHQTQLVAQLCQVFLHPQLQVPAMELVLAFLLHHHRHQHHFHPNILLDSPLLAYFPGMFHLMSLTITYMVILFFLCLELIEKFIFESYFSYPALFPKFHGAMGGHHGHPGGLLGAAAAAAAMSAAGSMPMGRPHGLGAGAPPVPPLDDDDVKGTIDKMMTSHIF